MPGLIPALAAVAIVAVAPAEADAQTMRDVEPYVAAIIQDNTPLRSGVSTAYYPVAMLREGQLVQVTGEDGVWSRVVYPPGLRAFVKAEEAQTQGQGTIALTQPSRLMAANLSGGERGHWQWLLEEELPAGAALPLTETLRLSDGKVYGYMVEAPPDAAGYIQGRSLRRATPAEVEAFRRASGAAAAEPAQPPTTAPAPSNGDAAQPAPDAPSAPGATPEAGTPTTTPPGTGGEPQAPSTVELSPAGAPIPEGPVVPADEPADQTPAPETAQPGEPTSADGTAQPAAPEERPVGSIESLRSLYEQVQNPDAPQEELATVIAEFERAIQALSADPLEQRTAQYLQGLLEVLKLRQELQKTLQQARERERQLSDAERRAREVVARAQANRVYTIVGRLLPSTVYDGRRLPKMYRIQSVDEGFPRNLGYLLPTEGVELESKINRVIGVVGESRFDPALRASIVQPRSVDVLAPAATDEDNASAGG